MDRSQLFELHLIFSESSKLLREYNLFEGSKWSAEALNGLQELDQDSSIQLFQHLQRSKGPTNSYFPKQTPQTEFLNFVESDKVLLASSYFNSKEFERCSHVLKNCKSPKALFIKLYSMYISGEKLKDDETGGGEVLTAGHINNGNHRDNHNPFTNNNSSNTKGNLNTKVSLIIKELDSYMENNNNKIDDPFLLYLYGLIHLKLQNISIAQEFFYQSITLYPFNWSCWSELIASLSNFNEAITFLTKISKNSKFLNDDYYNIMFLFFKITIHQEFYQQFYELYDDLKKLLIIFPNFSFLKIQKALISYNSLDYLTAEKLFDDILINDPLRLDDMDTYSNILYVMEKKSKLGFLAQFASSIDKFRPETCCIIANYYSLKFDHQKAIMYYKRALNLNRHCLSAWTLMGHEFVELKNSHAAIESYRRAVDTNNKDFRAWYGLGQAYEVLDMHLYSLYYYQKACALKPLDKRMWQAVGNCFENLNEYTDAIKSYQKALKVSVDYDPLILYKLATLYQCVNDIQNAYTFMRLCLEQESSEGILDETSKARLWLAKYEMSNKNWQLAYDYASEMTNGASIDIESARTIVREARIKLNELNNSNNNTNTSTSDGMNNDNPNINISQPGRRSNTRHSNQQHIISNRDGSNHIGRSGSRGI